MSTYHYQKYLVYQKAIFIQAFLYFFSVDTLAQDSTQNQSSKEIQLETITVSSKKLSEIQKEQAAYFFDISSKEIQSGAAQSTADVLQSSGKILVQKSQQGGGSPILRGFEANKVLLVVDGVRMNNLIYRGGHLQNSITVDPLSLSSIDVVMGQGSTLYGSDALGGVILLNTKKTPNFSNSTYNHLSMYSRYASANKGLNLHIDFSHAGKKWSTYSSVSYSDYSSLRMGSKIPKGYNNRTRPYYISTDANGQDNYTKNADPLVQVYSGYSQIDAIQKISLMHKDKSTSNLNLQYSHSSDIPRYDRLTTTTDSDSLKFAEWYYGPQVRLLIAYEFQKYFSSSKIGWNTIASYQNLKESRYKRNYLSPLRNANEENVHVYGLISTLEKPLKNGYIESGIDLNLGTVESIGYNLDIENQIQSYAQSRYPNGKNAQLSTALFALRHIDLNSSSYIDIGLRGGYNLLQSSIKPGTPNPYRLQDFTQKNWVYSIDISYRKIWENKFQFSANLGTGYRVPNLDDLAKIFDSSPGYLIVPNTDLKPEETINLNLNLGSKTKKIKWQFSPFASRMFRAIATRPYSLDGQDSVLYDGVLSQVVSNQNINAAWILGFNAEFSSHIWRELSIDTRLSYTYGELYTSTSTTPLDHIPPVVGRVGIAYAWEKLTINLDCMFNGAKTLDRYSTSGEDNLYYAPLDINGLAQGMPAWMTFNFKTNIQLKDRWQVNLGMDNILDRRYQVFASGILAPGRNIFVSLQFDR